jgi:hypothetical protein
MFNVYVGNNISRNMYNAVNGSNNLSYMYTTEYTVSGLPLQSSELGPPPSLTRKRVLLLPPFGPRGRHTHLLCYSLYTIIPLRYTL